MVEPGWSFFLALHINDDGEIIARGQQNGGPLLTVVLESIEKGAFRRHWTVRTLVPPVQMCLRMPEPAFTATAVANSGSRHKLRLTNNMYDRLSLSDGLRRVVRNIAQRDQMLLGDDV